MKSQFFVFFFLIFFTLSFGQETTTITKKQLHVTFATSSISIDGELNEDVWKNAEIAKDFIGFEPINGTQAPNELRSEVKVVYDNDAVYIGAILYDSEPSKILREVKERDEFGTSDLFGVFINGYNDGQQDFQFYVSAANGQADCNFTSQDGEDYSWNAIWSSKAKITDFGWIVEMKIPYAALRFPSTDIQTWGINFFREVRRNRQKYTWNHIDNKIGAFSQQAGVLKGIQKITPPTRLFLIPYVSGYLNTNKEETNVTLKGGLDIKYGLNDAFTLDAILIPDFGQTKFDNVVLNLGPFEQQFNENRPFFTEGTDLFNKGNLLYSRRIGAEPEFYPELADNETIDEYPSTVNLLNAVKISGRNNDGLGIGFLNAITKKTTVNIRNTDDNTSREAIVSPLTNYNVTVFDQRFNQNSSVSFINTNVTRDGDFRDANVSGLLFDLNTKANTYNLAGKVTMSSVYDTKNTSGISSSIYLAETSGKIRYSLGADYISKEFDNNDLGINFLTNYYDVFSSASYRILKPTKYFNSFRVNLNSYMEFNNTSNYIQDNNFNINVNSNTKKNHYFGFGFNYRPFENYDYYEARIDNRYLILPEFYSAFVDLSTNYNNKFALDINVEYSKVNEQSRENYSLFVSPRYRFNDKFSLIYAISPYIQKNNIGWVDFLSSSDEIIMARRDRNTINNTLTGKYSVSSQMNFSLSVRHYLSYAENNKFFTLQENGRLLENMTYNTNKNSNFNTWNLDLSYSWWFAPGSQATILYRNNASDFNRVINKSYGNNLGNVFADNLNHAFSISIRYFIDYNQAKNWL